MLERLYCPDFSPVFGEKFRDPFDFPMVDCLVWPIFENLSLPQSVHNLLSLVRNGNPLFYNRKISLGEFALELQCSGIETVLLQGMELGRTYGIPNDWVLEVAKLNEQVFSSILSVNPVDTNSVKELNSCIKTNPDSIAGIVIYPSYLGLNLVEDAPKIERLVDICVSHNFPLKIDAGNMHLPDNDRRLTDPRLIDRFLHSYPKLKVIISNGDIGSDLLQYFNLLKYHPNLAVEVDARSIGGVSPTKFFSTLFSQPGLVQNSFSRILIGSATPTMEISQMVRGLWESTEELVLAWKSLLRILGFRNAHRWYELKNITTKSEIFGKNLQLPKPYHITQISGPTKETDIKGSSGGFIELHFDLLLESFSITQLLWIQPALEEIVSNVRRNFPNFRNGEVQIRTKHTTTSLIINENEAGNFLQLHYEFVEKTRESPDTKLHTVMAAENRPDFNFPDHIVATTYGQKDIIVPYHNGELMLGSRENIYLLTTFGPRSVHLLVTFKLYPET
ncbi:MAG: YjbQ family protein [Candidatus Jordarchaeaceae archaeon]